MSTSTRTISPKVTAASLTAAGTTVAMYALAQIPFVAGMPPLVQGALGVLVTGALTGLAGWLTRDPLRRSR